MVLFLSDYLRSPPPLVIIADMLDMCTYFILMVINHRYLRVIFFFLSNLYRFLILEMKLSNHADLYFSNLNDFKFFDN